MTQAEAEAKLLAEPSLIGVSNIHDFKVSFRANASERHVRPRSDKIIPAITKVLLTYKGRA
jgi:hypothetical protein